MGEDVLGLQDEVRARAVRAPEMMGGQSEGNSKGKWLHLPEESYQISEKTLILMFLFFILILYSNQDLRLEIIHVN